MKLNLQIKVCGMRDVQNIMDVAGLRPDMMGFIFYPGSKRFVGEDFHIPGINKNIEKAGVFVNENPDKVIEVLINHNLQTAQLHGNERPEECLKIRSAGFKVIKAFGINDKIKWDELLPYIPVTDIFILDTQTKLHGGSGSKFNWEILKSYPYNHPFLLSGGIKPEDTGILQEFYHPECIGFDINSGFETAPALKDVKNLELFIKDIRKY